MGQATNRSSTETLDLVITNALIIDWSGIYKVFGVSICAKSACSRWTGGHWCQGWSYLWNRKGRKSRHHGERSPFLGYWVVHRSHRRRKAYCDRRSCRCPCPLHLSTASGGSIGCRYHDDDWRRDWAFCWNERDDVYIESVLHETHAGSNRWASNELRFHR